MQTLVLSTGREIVIATSLYWLPWMKIISLKFVKFWGILLIDLRVKETLKLFLSMYVPKHVHRVTQKFSNTH
jgi:hypothetical protein